MHFAITDSLSFGCLLLFCRHWIVFLLVQTRSYGEIWVDCVIVHTIEINFFPLVSWTVHHHHTRLNKNKQFICAMQICFFTFCNCEWQSMLHSSSKGIETRCSLKMQTRQRVSGWLERAMASDGNSTKRVERHRKQTHKNVKEGEKKSIHTERIAVATLLFRCKSP